MHVAQSETVKSRCRYIVLSQIARQPLALVAIALSVIGVLENHAGVDFLLRLSMQGASTHPTTGLVIIMLAVLLVQKRGFQPFSRMQISLLTIALGYLLFKLLGKNAYIDAMAGQFSGSSWGAMGTDTGLTLALLYAAVLLQRSRSKLGLACAVAAASFIAAAFLGFSYGRTLFEGQMAVSTLIAMVPLSLSVLTLYARRPMLRVIMLAGPVGDRTRNTIAVGFLVPWLGGLVLYRWVGVPDRVIPAEALIVGFTMLSMAMVAIASGLYHEKVDWKRRQLSRELIEMASVDHLTKALNRNGISFELTKRWNEFQNFGKSQCVLLIDLDHFKKINDEHGHDQGDIVLAAVTTTLRPCLRAGDALGRWGGEEFLVLVQDVDTIKAVALAERLRRAVADIPMIVAPANGVGDVLPYIVTASIGVAFFQGEDTRPDDAIKRADLALYQAKTKGRNRVEAIVSTRKDAA